MRAPKIVSMLFVSLAVAISARGIPAQQVIPVPQVVTTGRGEVDVKPDRAHIEFSVETRANSATAAAAENSRRQRAVVDTLQRMGIATDQLQTSNLQVTPEMAYPGQGLPPKVSGYVARNSVRVEVLKLDQAGVLVDAALTKGATGITGLQFYSSTAAEARREALSRAVSAARLDAEAMAKAAGYQLGMLIEIAAGNAADSPVLMSMAMAPAPRMALRSADPTPVNPGELKITEVVSVRWSIKQ